MSMKQLAILAFIPLAACTTVKEAVRGPELAPVGYPSSLMPRDQMLLSARDPMPTPASANSLWRTGARALASPTLADAIASHGHVAELRRP